MTPSMLKEQFPWLNTDGIAIGCFGKIRSYLDYFSTSGYF
jgi:hypothetical protein